MDQNIHLQPTAPSIWIAMQIALTLLTMPLWASAQADCNRPPVLLSGEGSSPHQAETKLPCRMNLRLSQGNASAGTNVADPAASDPEFITDRPDQTESAATVAPGYVQVEAGWTLGQEKAGGARRRSHEFPGTLLRTGITPGVELRLGWTGYAWEQDRMSASEVNRNGVADAELGAKFRLRSESEEGPWPEVAFLVGTSLPVGDGAFSSDRADPSFRLSLGHTLSDRFGVGYNVGMEWESSLDESGRSRTLSHYLYTMVLGVGLTDRLGSFVEVFGEVGASAPGAPAHSVDGGFTYLLRSNLQIDIAAGVGLSDAAADWFLGAGFSIRLPK